MKIINFFKRKKFKSITEFFFFVLISIFFRFRFLIIAEIISLIAIRFIFRPININHLLSQIYHQKRNYEKERKYFKKYLLDNLKIKKVEPQMLAEYFLICSYCKNKRDIKIFLKYSIKNSSVYFYGIGLLRYLENESDFKNYFSKSIKIFFNDKKKEIPNYIKMIINFETKYNYKKNYNQINIKKLNFLDKDQIRIENYYKSKEPIVLVGSDYTYFKIFYSHYVKLFFETNNNYLHFHLFLKNKKELIRLSDIKLLNNNILISYEYIKKKNFPTSITIDRFKICYYILRKLKKDVMLTDIDLNPNFSLKNISKKIIKQDCKFGFVDEKFGVPWAKYAAGFCYFTKKDKIVLSFLSTLINFFDKKRQNQMFWTVDQTGLFLVSHLYKKNINFKILNLNNHVNFQKMLDTPWYLQRKKIKSKMTLIKKEK
ncbi:hypothetical protein [Candidatus Pelagibacter sp.]|uniref:hypothetical protein n=1 Tax=Candidatus Pelagibacter sp. TaxID=2024849 RepID=UPI003D123BC4